jgi:inosine-uridine nucleoside N-ribohydrolase
VQSSLLQVRPAPGIVFDSDLGDGIEAVLALALLYGLDTKGDVRAVALSLTRNDLGAAAFVEAVMKFYAAGGFSRTMAVGMADESKPQPASSMISTALARKKADGSPAYTYTIHNVNDTAEVGALLRNAFTAQHDGNGIMVTAGPASNLARLLAVPGAKELLQRKCSVLVMAAGVFGEGAPDPHVTADIASAKKVFAEWPGPVVAVGQEIGNQVLFPGESIEKDFTHSPEHPIVDAYRAARQMPYDASTWDMAAILYAARPKETFFRTSEAGTITVADDGRITFRPSANGLHRYLIANPAEKDRLIATYRQLASVKPVPRRRPGPPQVNQQKPQAPKPPEVKPPSSSQ